MQPTSKRFPSRYSATSFGEALIKSIGISYKACLSKYQCSTKLRQQLCKRKGQNVDICLLGGERTCLCFGDYLLEYTFLWYMNICRGTDVIRPFHFFVCKIENISMWTMKYFYIFIKIILLEDIIINYISEI
jgi:hypothetical protein